MKKSIVSSLFHFMLSISLINMVFAQSTAGGPISDTPIGLEHDPAGIAINPIKTDAKGNFSFSKLTEGKYKLTLPYDLVIKAAVGLEKSNAAKLGSYEVDLLLQGVTSNGGIFDRSGKPVKTVSKIIINRETRVISIVVPKGGGSLNGTLSVNKTAISPR